MLCLPGQQISKKTKQKNLTDIISEVIMLLEKLNSFRFDTSSFTSQFAQIE